ncbi:MAG: pyridoxamine 5'-phosphate oxidase family protein [Candidatus Latescibacteria bacterium]|nr:pyridoxamine 5'-phosphate oxidase family protein [Candidatus Latescibacterota bacterium]
MSDYEVTPQTKIKRLPKRAVYDRQQIYGILDEALLCHVGFVQDDQPFVIPTIHARIGNTIFVHGSAASRMLRSLEGGISACVTVTLLDGLVLARSTFHHSMNYRSAVILGTLKLVSDSEKKREVLDTIVEHVIPGRSAEARGPNEQELKATSVLSMDINEASAKIRTGPPGDEEEDYSLPVWAGVIPLSLEPGTAEADDRLVDGVKEPDYVTEYHR